MPTPGGCNNLLQIKQIWADNPINLINLSAPIVHLCVICDFCERILERLRDGSEEAPKVLNYA